MGACFLHNGGSMHGMDIHTFIVLGPEGIPLPGPWPHTVRVPQLKWASDDEKKRCFKVLSVGQPMLKIGFCNAVVPHVPIPGLPPHPTESLALFTIVLFSSSKALLGVASVTGEGGALATCAYGAIGVSANCGPGAGVVLNESTVVTNPTASDFADFALEWAFDVILSQVAGALVPKSVTDALPKAFVKKLVKDMMKYVIKHYPVQLGGT